MAAIPSSEPLFVPDSHPYGFQRAAAPVDSTVTLLVKHLPEAIPQDTLTRLFSHYGASAVRPCSSGRLKNCAFVDFRNDSQAHQAQRQLNGLRFLGKVLVVERANSSTKVNELQHGRARSADETTTASSLPKTTLTATDMGDKLNAGSGSTKEPIAPKLGIDYPFPPHLEYAYPPPDGNILTNIVNALIAVPHFYTQVLHLMNKMNIPAPFRAALPTPPLPSAAPPAPCAPTIAEPSAADLSESESEMESSEEDGGDKHEVPEFSRVGRPGKKRKRGEAIVGPAVDKGVTHEAVGLKPATLLPKEIPLIKKNNPILQIKITPKSSKAEEKDDADDNPEKEKSNNESFASPEELEKGKLPLEEILSLPKFKNYAAGNPATVLYMKNLAKDVVQDDFYFIFGSLFGSIDGAKTNLTVKLMQEGRMRGQAFVTFPSIELARNALNMVNGYVFKGKPMIIQFGRNASSTAS